MKTGVNVSSSRTYLLRLSGRVEVSVELTGMTTDFDCTVSGNRCTNRGGTRDDSWSGTLDAGDHKIVVYPYGGGSGDYTLTVSAQTPSTGGSTGTTTQVTTLVDVSRTGVSTSQTHSFTLSGPAEVDVALTGLTIDFDCRVGSSRCTNRWGTLADSWSGNLAEGDHSVVVYPYDPGPGDYSLTVTATETVTVVTTPLGGGAPRIRLSLCEEDDGRIVEGTCREVVVGGGPGQGTPGPGDGGDGGDGGGGGGGGGDEETPEDELTNLCYTDLVRDSTKVTSNPLENNRALGRNHGGRNTSRPNHNGIDIRANRGDDVLAAAGGRVTEIATGHGTNEWNEETMTFSGLAPANGNFVRIVDSQGREQVYLHLNTVGVRVNQTVAQGAVIGAANNSGNSLGDHLHYTLWADEAHSQALDGEALADNCGD